MQGTHTYKNKTGKGHTDIKCSSIALLNSHTSVVRKRCKRQCVSIPGLQHHQVIYVRTYIQQYQPCKTTGTVVTTKKVCGRIGNIGRKLRDLLAKTGQGMPGAVSSTPMQQACLISCATSWDAFLYRSEQQGIYSATCTMGTLSCKTQADNQQQTSISGHGDCSGV